MIERAFINYKLTGNDEVFRQQLKIFSSRVVIARQILGSNFDWLTKGVIANYNELQNVCDYLNDGYKNIFVGFILSVATENTI